MGGKSGAGGRRGLGVGVGHLAGLPGGSPSAAARGLDTPLPPLTFLHAAGFLTDRLSSDDPVGTSGSAAGKRPCAPPSLVSNSQWGLHSCSPVFPKRKTVRLNPGTLSSLGLEWSFGSHSPTAQNHSDQEVCVPWVNPVTWPIAVSCTNPRRLFRKSVTFPFSVRKGKENGSGPPGFPQLHASQLCGLRLKTLLLCASVSSPEKRRDC